MAKLRFAPIEDPNGINKYPELWMPPKRELWSISPIITDEGVGNDSISIRLRQGIVCKIEVDTETLIQNVNENEDDYIDFSFHGDPEGIWGKLNTHSLLRVDGNIFLLNRTQFDVLYVAAF